MADRNSLVNALMGKINSAADGAKNSINLLVEDPSAWLSQAAKHYLPSPEEEKAYSPLGNLKNGVYNTDYFQKVMGLTPLPSVLNQKSKNYLVQLLQGYEKSGPTAKTLHKAIELTPSQQNGLEGAFSQQWGKQYPVPGAIDLKPKHGYESRVLKDGFSSSDYVKWLENGAADEATVTVDRLGRPALTNQFVDPTRGTSYSVRIPIRSDSSGAVYADDVIPAIKPQTKTPRR